MQPDQSFFGWQERDRAAKAKRARRAVARRYAVFRGGWGMRSQLDLAATIRALDDPGEAMRVYRMTRWQRRKWFYAMENFPCPS